MKLANLEVVVVGGATAGCAAALFLARAGARVTLLERVAEPRAVGAGIGIAANGMAVLDALGLGETMREMACSVAGARVVDARGRVLLDPGETSSRVWMMRRSDLQALLLEAVEREPGIAARFGAEVLSAHPDGRVMVSSPRDGSEVTADLVVGADGVHSKVRAGGDFGARVDPEGIAYLRGIAEGVEPLNEEAWTPAGLFGSFPIPGGTYWYASAGAPAVSRALGDGDLAAFRAAWLHASPRAERILAALASLGEIDVRRVVRVECRRWSSGRLVLAGDAVHAMAPNLGQGANSALVDAAVLGDELAKAADLESGLAAYQARRRRAVRKVAVTAARLGALAERTGPVARFLRDRILMPVAARLTGPGAEAALFQEPPEILRAIGRG